MNKINFSKFKNKNSQGQTHLKYDSFGNAHQTTYNSSIINDPKLQKYKKG